MNLDSLLANSVSAGGSTTKETIRLDTLPPKCIQLIASLLDMKTVFSLNHTCILLNQALSTAAQIDAPYTEADESLSNLNDANYSNNNINNKNLSSSIPIHSELRYKFPNRFQYNHSILLETPSNIFKPFRNIKSLHLVIAAPPQTAVNPSNTYLTNTNFKDKVRHKSGHKLGIKSNKSAVNQYGDYIILDSSNMTERLPVTKVETNIYSRAIFNYFERHFPEIETLCITFV